MSDPSKPKSDSSVDPRDLRNGELEKQIRELKAKVKEQEERIKKLEALLAS